MKNLTDKSWIAKISWWALFGIPRIPESPQGLVFHALPSKEEKASGESSQLLSAGGTGSDPRVYSTLNAQFRVLSRGKKWVIPCNCLIKDVMTLPRMGGQMEMTQRAQIWGFWIFKKLDLELVKIVSIRPGHRRAIK